ncbi:MAG: hypothetical protein ABIG42_06990, partial [bacterium]
MTFSKTLAIVLLLIFFVILSSACSNAKSPLEPATENLSGVSDDLPDAFVVGAENRSLLAVYDAVIDPSTQSFTISPAERTGTYHYPLTSLYPGVLTITGYGFEPNFWADIMLLHPFPHSGIDAFDPRVIAILPANPGVRFIYPAMGVGGNNAVVLEPDGYTKLFDDLGGVILGNVNPFKAYFKGAPYRRWSITTS